MIRDFQQRRPEDARRRRRLLAGSVVGHVLVVLLPLAVMLFDRWFGPEPELESINIEEMPSVGPEVAPETTRLPPEPEPTPPEPEPTPPEPTPPEPAPVTEPELELPEVPEIISEPDLDLPKPPKQPVAIKEPKIKLPPVPKTRELTDKKKPKPQTGRNDNPLVPVGPKETAQTHGEKPSNTAQGGPNRSDRYTALISQFLKVKWQEYSPSLANMRSDASVGVRLSISPGGRLLSWSITRSSGNAEMDAAAKRLLEHLKTTSLPKNPDGKTWENTVNFGTKFNNW